MRLKSFVPGIGVLNWRGVDCAPRMRHSLDFFCSLSRGIFMLGPALAIVRDNSHQVDRSSIYGEMMLLDFRPNIAFEKYMVFPATGCAVVICNHVKSHDIQARKVGCDTFRKTLQPGIRLQSDIDCVATVSQVRAVLQGDKLAILDDRITSQS